MPKKCLWVWPIVEHVISKVKYHVSTCILANTTQPNQAPSFYYNFDFTCSVNSSACTNIKWVSGYKVHVIYPDTQLNGSIVRIWICSSSRIHIHVLWCTCTCIMNLRVNCDFNCIHSMVSLLVICCINYKKKGLLHTCIKYPLHVHA